jgi:hypothetical protein
MRIALVIVLLLTAAALVRNTVGSPLGKKGGIPAGPHLVITFSPPNPTISSGAALGSTVATMNVIWSDGSPFTGTTGFTVPYSSDSNTFAISGNNLIIDPAGPGILADGGTVQNISITATQ